MQAQTLPLRHQAAASRCPSACPHHRNVLPAVCSWHPQQHLPQDHHCPLRPSGPTRQFTAPALTACGTSTSTSTPARRSSRGRPASSATPEAATSALPASTPHPAPQLTIRRAQTLAELEAVSQIRAEAYYEDDRSRFVESFKKKFVRLEVESLQERTQPPTHGARRTPRVECLIALDEDGAVAGCIDLRLPFLATGVPPNGVPAADVAGCYFLNVVVDSKRREGGVGTALLQAAVRRARGVWHAERLYTHVEADNEVAYRLYRRCGFEELSAEFTMEPASKLGQLMFLVQDVSGMVVEEDAGVAEDARGKL